MNQEMNLNKVYYKVQVTKNLYLFMNLLRKNNQNQKNNNFKINKYQFKIKLKNLKINNNHPILKKKINLNKIKIY